MMNLFNAARSLMSAQLAALLLALVKLADYARGQMQARVSTLVYQNATNAFTTILQLNMQIQATTDELIVFVAGMGNVTAGGNVKVRVFLHSPTGAFPDTVIAEQLCAPTGTFLPFAMNAAKDQLPAGTVEVQLQFANENAGPTFTVDPTLAPEQAQSCSLICTVQPQ